MEPQERGEAPIVVGIEVVGNRRYSTEQILGALGQPVGAPLDPVIFERGLDGLWSTFRIAARIEERQVLDGVILVVEVVEEVEYDLSPVFVGNTRVDVEELRRWADLEEGEKVYISQAERMRRRIEVGYRRDGFYFAEVDIVRSRPSRGEAGFDEADAERPLELIFRIYEGPRVRVSKVVVEGNDSLPDSRFLFWGSGLKHEARPELGRPFLGFLFPDKFVREDLEADLIAMRQVYRDRGFLDAVVEAEPFEFSRDRDWVTIRIRVDEGPRYRVSSLELEAVDPRSPRLEGMPPEALEFQLDELLELCNLEPGSFLQQRVMAGDSQRVRRRYGEAGFLSHPSIPDGERWQWLEPQLVFDVDTHEVAVTYRFTQGERQFLREVIIRGAAHTKDHVVRRYITAHPGEQADLNEIDRSVARLARTGFFTNPNDPAAVPPRYVFVETDEPGWKDLEFVLDDIVPVQLNIGGGFSSNSGLIGQFEMDFTNFDITSWPSSPFSLINDVKNRTAFHGAGQRLNFFLRPGTQFNAFGVTFSDPDIFNLYEDQIGFSATARRTIVRQPGYDEGRNIVTVGLSRQLSPDSRLFLNYAIAEVTVDDLDSGGEPNLFDPTPVPDLLKAQEGESNVSYLELRYNRTTVDDFLFPRSGSQVSFATRLYDPVVGSDFSFVRSLLSADLYVPLGDLADVPPGLRFKARLGAAETFGSTDDVPYTERFFLGGNGLRGFRRQRVGPNDRGIPLGGQTSLSAGIEYRFPLRKQTRPGGFDQYEALRALVFTDAGILDPDSFELRASQLRASVGVGLGLSLGPFPITLSYAWVVSDGEGDRERNLLFDIGFR